MKLRAALAAIALLAQFASPGRAQDALPRAVIVLDLSKGAATSLDPRVRSASTSTQIALSRTLPRFEGGMELGMVAFGHRRDSGCRAVKRVLPPQRLSAGRFLGELAKLGSGGRAPLSRALQIAASSKNFRGGPPNIVVITSSLDGCDANPCAATSGLKIRWPNIRIHLIAFAPTPGRGLKRLRCVAERTGGQFVRVRSEDALVNALSRVLAIARRTYTPPKIPATGWGAEPKTDKAASIAKPGGRTAPADTPSGAGAAKIPRAPDSVSVKFSALLKEDYAPIRSGLVWRVFALSKSGKSAGKLLATSGLASPQFWLRPGTYYINAAYGLAHLTHKLDVGAGPALASTFILNAGGLRLRAVDANGAPLPRRAVTYDIYSDNEDQFGNRERLVAGLRPGGVIRLNAGIYHIVSTYGLANATTEADVSVESGKLTEASLAHIAGKVTLKLAQRPGGEALANVRWRVLTPTGSLVTQSIGALPSHTLAAGEYKVEARYAGKTYAGTFKLVAGEARQVEVLVQ